MRSIPAVPFQRFRRWSLPLVLAACACAAEAQAIGRDAIVSFGHPSRAAVVLLDQRRTAPIHLDGGDFAGVHRAAHDLQADIERDGGVRPRLGMRDVGAASSVILIGTLGKSAQIDRLARENKIDAAKIRGKWEGYLIQTVEAPMPGVERALVIAGSDKRGTIFGIYELSEQIGVSPWYWWADVPVPKRRQLSVPATTLVADAPVVRYRGIFLNDEAPALTNWAKERFGGFNHKFYERLFELMLRMKANYLWPAMWQPAAFYDDDPKNGKLADDMGIVMGTSHHEPMMRAHDEWSRYGRGPWDYGRNAGMLQDFWRKGLRTSKDQERVITLGMRGDGDEPMSEHDNVELLQKIVSDQRTLIAQETGKPAESVPQLWALYKEVQGYYERGMRVPDDVMLLWCDDNWGNIRRLPTPEERRRTGGAGVYYHFDYVGVPRSYKWLNVTQIPKIWEQMNLANKFGANRMWIVNVGDLKPMEIPTEFFLTYAWNPDAWPAGRLPEYLRTWASREFGPAHAAEIADIVKLYTRYNARRRPEQLDGATYSHANYREAERVVADYNALAARAQRISDRLAPGYRDAFFQLVLYPVRAAAAATDMVHAAYLNRLYAVQGRASTNDMAQRVRDRFKLNIELADHYHRGIAGGKWKHMMSQTKFGYTNWDQPFRDVMPAVSELYIPPKPMLTPPNGIHRSDEMGVAVQGMEEAWPMFPPKKLVLPVLDALDRQPRFVEVFSRSREAVEYTIRADRPWIKLSHTGGKVAKDQRILVDVDWDAAPAGASTAELSIGGPRKAVIKVTVPLNKRPAGMPPLAGHMETAGAVSIEAEHYTRALAPPGRSWLTIPDYGHTLSGVTALPVEAPPLDVKDGMRLEYQVNLSRPGTVKVQAILGPTQKFQPGEGMRYAISFDDERPQIVNVHADESEGNWRKIVSDGVARFTTTHSVTGTGPHVLKFWSLHPGLVLQKLVIDNGGVKPSYLGPPESPYVRTTPQPLAAAAAASPPAGHAARPRPE
jgi:hypothetical protein